MYKVRRVNQRHRGPIQSGRLDQFYQNMMEAIEELQGKHETLTQDFSATKQRLLKRSFADGLTVCYPNADKMMEGIEIMYPPSPAIPSVDRIGVFGQHDRPREGVSISLPNGIHFVAQQSIRLDEIIGEINEVALRDGDIPIGSLIHLHLQKAQAEREGLL